MRKGNKQDKRGQKAGRRESAVGPLFRLFLLSFPRKSQHPRGLVCVCLIFYSISQEVKRGRETVNGAVYVHVCIRPEGLVAGRWLCVNKPGEYWYTFSSSVQPAGCTLEENEFFARRRGGGVLLFNFFSPSPPRKTLSEIWQIAFLHVLEEKERYGCTTSPQKRKRGRSMNLSWGMVSLSLWEHLAKWGMQKSATQM